MTLDRGPLLSLARGHAASTHGTHVAEAGGTGPLAFEELAGPGCLQLRTGTHGKSSGAGESMAAVPERELGASLPRGSTHHGTDGRGGGWNSLAVLALEALLVHAFTAHRDNFPSERLLAHWSAHSQIA